MSHQRWVLAAALRWAAAHAALSTCMCDQARLITPACNELPQRGLCHSFRKRKLYAGGFLQDAPAAACDKQGVTCGRRALTALNWPITNPCVPCLHAPAGWRVCSLRGSAGGAVRTGAPAGAQRAARPAAVPLWPERDVPLLQDGRPGGPAVRRCAWAARAG